MPRPRIGGKDVIIPSGHVQDRVVTPPRTTLKLYPLGTAAAPCPSDLLIRRATIAALGGFEEHFTGARQMYEDQGFLAKPFCFDDLVRNVRALAIDAPLPGSR